MHGAITVPRPGTRALRRGTRCSSLSPVPATFTPLLPRIALYSIISGIEEDLRLAITRGLEGVEAQEVLGPELRERAAERAEQDLGVAPVEIAELLPYV